MMDINYCRRFILNLKSTAKFNIYIELALLRRIFQWTSCELMFTEMYNEFMAMQKYEHSDEKANNFPLDF